MVRRSFRMGLWLGVLAGVLFALVKVMQSRRDEQASSPEEPVTWPPIDDVPLPDETVTEAGVEDSAEPGPAPVTAPAPAPVAGMAEVPDLPAVPDPPRAPQPAKKAAKKAVKKAATARKPAKKAAKKAATRATKAAKRAAKAAAKAVSGQAWVEASAGVCPQSHPVKAKVSSRLYHMPGMAFYNRTHADRCYADEDAAAGDGFSRAKR